MSDRMTPLLTPSAPNLTAALRASGQSEESARHCVGAYMAALVLGWDTAAANYPRSTWYRYLVALQSAGVDVPLRARGQRTQSGYGVTTLADIWRLVGRPFSVVEAWDPEFHPEGTTGRVFQVVVQDGQFFVDVELDGIPGGDERLRLGTALKVLHFEEEADAA